ncbi:GPO family capsid scaffolding protein [Aeromonas dhakensis]|uniref:GPO family capsid scaffolding protein n=1 Tax=Aeromonas TaxID=642 RepID=UPI000F459406|nr:MULTISPECIES: GPO family capsid scaffolding protein [Aeromonas]MBL0533143.1 GPO family capsid scaffolding protein [Aeromonas dhakensis]NME01804.1 GPO family capsid scaffolding protein [Aeromonas sp. DNRA1]WAG17142.1 GPO family capsid scaffolding protein [Aeromonas hydrophila]GKQ96470.1 phage capsid protein [Aeromonas hydrophila]
MAKSKFFRVAVEGGTTDGRAITREWLEQMAQRYNQSTYGARVNMEHIRGIDPNGLFKMYGDITAAKTEEVTIEGEQRLALFVQIDPTPELVELNKKRQKVFTSVEIHPNLNEKGAYLMGLAITDSPASLGTDMLQFCAGAGDKSPLASRKQHKECLFTEALETVIEFESEQEKGPSLAERIAALFSSHKKQSTADFSDVHQAVETVAKEVTTLDADLQKKFTEQAQTLTELTNKQDATAKALADLTAKLEGQEAFNQQRPPATGGDSASIQTDC